MSSATRSEIDRILDAIRAEARARGSKGRVGAYPSDVAAPAASGPVQVVTQGAPALEVRHAADFLAMPLDVFLFEAYRMALGRDPDPAGAVHYQRQLLRGRLTRIEVLGRLSFSSEGRRSRLGVPGLAPAFVLATSYRVPLAGPLLAIVARALRLPAHWQDRSAIESTALATGSWMKR